MLDLLLPQRCVVCSEPGKQLCVGCIGAFVRLRPPLCDCCGAPTAWPVVRCRECAGRRLAFARARAAIVYDPAATAFVWAWKERGLRRLAALAARLVAEVVPRPEADAVTFVPPDRDRRLKRGHHPAEALAGELAERWEIPRLALLERTRSIRRQRGLPLGERRRNVRGAFRASTDVPQRVAVVDDIYTSGATAAAAGSALRTGGAQRVEVVAFARAVR
jgi:predicted amidophosphoribosyltransferase